MATATQRTRLRADIGATVTSLPDDDADDIFTEAGEEYTDASSIKAYTRVLAIQRLFASAAKLADYTQNQSQEKQSQVFDHLKTLLAFWRGKLADATAAASANGAARFAGMRRKPKRIKEYPGGS